MRKYIEIFIAIAFLGYGLIRLGVGSALLGQELGIIDFQVFHGPVDEIGMFIAKSSERQIIPLSVSTYVGYIALMGLVLSIGALGVLRKLPSGLFLIGVFIVMYAFLFVNFQTINPKAIHLGICVVLFGVLLWLKAVRRKVA